MEKKKSKADIVKPLPQAGEDLHEKTVEEMTADDYDAHSCRAEADAYGYCQWCGAIVSGTSADYEEHGYDPPESTFAFSMRGRCY